MYFDKKRDVHVQGILIEIQHKALKRHLENKLGTVNDVASETV